MRTLVSTRVPEQWPIGTDVLALDLDVRERSNRDAADAILAAAHLRPERVLVKIDSTLRGPVRGLVGGALHAFACEQAVVAPAFPEQGRIVRDGSLYVHGQHGPTVREVIGDDGRCVIHDAESPADLRRLAEEAHAHPRWLLVGSAGLARQLAPPHESPTPQPNGDGPVLLVAGSPAPVTRAQLVPLTDVNDLVILATPPTDARDSGEAASALADQVALWAMRHRPKAVVLTGGATARAVIHGLGTTHLSIHGELQPGIPFGALQDGLWHGVTVVTKAGGFGTPSTLLDVVRELGVTSTG